MTVPISPDRLSSAPSSLTEKELSRCREVESGERKEGAAIPLDQNALSLSIKTEGRFDTGAPVLKKPAAAAGAHQINIQAALDSMVGGEGRSAASDVHQK